MSRVLTEPACRAAAERWATRFAAVDGPAVAADRIVALYAELGCLVGVPST